MSQGWRGHELLSDPRRLTWLGVIAIAVASSVGWLPFVDKGLSPDEGGYLLIGSQWSPGASLYGNYWVDRPPLLIGIFGLADRLGGTVALRLIGTAAVVGSVLVAGLLGRLAARSRSVAPVVWPAAVAAVFLSTPVFGTTEVNGELLAVPFVLGGSASLLASWRSPWHHASWVWALAAGGSGAAAALVKQNVVDVFVLAIAMTLMTIGHGRTRPALLRLACVGCGAAATALVALGYAWSRGTDPAALWDAVVTFRFDATSVIRSSANAATGMRFQHLTRDLLVSGAPAVVLAAAWRMRRPALPPPLSGSGSGLPRTPYAPDLRWPATAVLAWELIAVGMGGSYWSHYLIGVVPGLILVVVAAGQRSPVTRTASWWIAPALTWAALVAVIGVITLGTRFSPGHGVDAQTVAYLRSHGAVGDTIVVAFGHPDIVEETGMSSPYPELWSLPVRVRDNQLRQLNGVLAGPSRPTWVVVSGETLTTWGVDTAVAQATLDHGYREVGVTDTYRIYHVRALRS